MAKLKISNVIRLICDTCNGNGFIKIQDPEDKTEINVHQCWECESEGEFYEVVSTDDISDYDDSDDNTSNKLH